MCVPPAICQVWGRPPGPAAPGKLLRQSAGNLTGWQRLLDRKCRFLYPWLRYTQPLSQTCTRKQRHQVPRPPIPSSPHPHLPLRKEKCPLPSDFPTFDPTLCCPLFLSTDWPPEEEDSGGLHLLTVTPVGLMLLIILAALGFFYSKKRYEQVLLPPAAFSP